MYLFQLKSGGSREFFEFSCDVKKQQWENAENNFISS